MRRPTTQQPRLAPLLDGGASPLLVMGALLMGVGCQTVHVQSPTDGLKISVDEGEPVELGREGVDVEVGMGFSGVPYRLETEAGEVFEGELPRNDTRWWLVGGAVTAGALLTPPLVALAYVLANPAAWMAFLPGADPTSLLLPLSRPSLITIPMVAGAVVAGMAPTSVLLVSQALPDVIEIRVPEGASVGGEVSHGAHE